MAREIVVWCDAHLAKDEHEAGTSRETTLEGRTSTIDLCDTCWKEVAGPLLELLASSAQPEAKALPPGRRPVDCPECGLGLAARSNLNAHLEAKHGTTLSAWETEHGMSVTGEELPYECSVRKCGLRFPSAQGAAMHRRRVHDLE